MKTLRIRLFAAALMSAALCCGCQQLSLTGSETARLTFPPARRDSTVEVYHGTDKTVSKVIDEQADIYAFVFKTLNMSYGNTGETHLNK